MATRTVLELDRTADATTSVRRRSTSSPDGGSASLLLQLQQSAGNAAVAQCMSRGRTPGLLGGRATGRWLARSTASTEPMDVVQRCGPVPCNCSAEERAERESAPGADGDDRENVGTKEDAPIQRSAVEVQRHEVEDCGAGASTTHPASEVHAAHGRARTMVSIAEMETADSTDPNVQRLARKYFKISVPPVTTKDKKLWFGRVRQVMRALNTLNSQTTYECESKQSFANGACSTGSMAVTVLNIHLCPDWWALVPEDRAFVLIHEWAHKYGPSVNQIFETYCEAKGFAGLAAERLVAEPDAYAGYVFELVTGSSPSAAVCG